MPAMYTIFFDEDALHVDHEVVPVFGMDVTNVDIARAILLDSFDNGAKELERIIVNQGVPAQGVPARAVPDQGVPDQEVPDQEVPDLVVPMPGISAVSRRNQRALNRQTVKDDTGFGKIIFDEMTAPSTFVARQMARERASKKHATAVFGDATAVFGDGVYDNNVKFAGLVQQQISKTKNKLSNQKRTVNGMFIPRCYTQAMKNRDKWEPPTLAEFDSMLSENVWKVPEIDIINIPREDIFPSMLIYDKKKNTSRWYIQQRQRSPGSKRR